MTSNHIEANIVTLAHLHHELYLLAEKELKGETLDEYTNTSSYMGAAIRERLKDKISFCISAIESYNNELASINGVLNILQGEFKQNCKNPIATAQYLEKTTELKAQLDALKKEVEKAIQKT